MSPKRVEELAARLGGEPGRARPERDGHRRHKAQAMASAFPQATCMR